MARHRVTKAIYGKFQDIMHREMTFWIILSVVIHLTILTGTELLNRRHFLQISTPGPTPVSLITEAPAKPVPQRRKTKNKVKVHRQRVVKSIPRAKVVVRKQRIIRRIKKGAIATRNPREEQLKKALEKIKRNVQQRSAQNETTTPPASGGTPGEKNLYFSAIQHQIMRSWILPENLIENLYDLEAIVNFIIHADGSISDIRLEESSGNKTFDTSAVRAVKQAAPFPAFPRTIRKKSIDIGIRFRPEEKLDG